jgi:uncharacterized protein (PEP-CTERM system associated)
VTAVPFGPRAHLTCAIAAGCLLGARVALAFPASDPANPSVLTNTPPPTEGDLRHQLQLQSGFFAPSTGGGWTFTPGLSLEEAWTDNILNSGTDRRWDLLTIVTPSFSLVGDTPNAQVQLSFGPEFRLAARTHQENSITNQLLGTGLFTIVPDEFYLDARAFAGSAPLFGGFGSLEPGIVPNLANLNTQFAGTGTIGLSNQNTVQTSSLSISPYWLHQFGDTGTAKIGYSFTQSSYAQGNSYLPAFIPTGANAVHQLTNEGTAQFTTGERFAPFNNIVSADLQESTGNSFAGKSSNYTFYDRLSYDVNRDISVFGELGHENIYYGSGAAIRINDVIWLFGGTWTPNPDSTITISYGHQDGTTSVEVDGSYALTPRTRISASYNNGVQTYLQGIGNQLDLAALNASGQAVNSQTGAPLLFGTNGLGVQNGVFRSKAFTLTGTTVLDRDEFSVSLQVAENTTLAQAPVNFVSPFAIPAPPVGSTDNSKSVYLSWLHQIHQDLTLTTSAAYSTSQISGSGNEQSVAGNVTMQYLLSPTLTATASYSYFNRTSTIPGVGFYQNLVLVGLSKQF